MAKYEILKQFFYNTILRAIAPIIPLFFSIIVFIIKLLFIFPGLIYSYSFLLNQND